MAAAKNVQQLARQLFKLSVVDGAVSAERVAGVLAYLEKHKPAGLIAVLKVYHRLIATELARSRALVEHAGSVSESTLQAIAAALTGQYRRPIAAEAREDKKLLAGLRVRVGDDVYETSVAGHLATLAASV